MSHFTLLVIGEEPEKQLAPFHEFECTGEDNEFVVELDQTAEAREKYEQDTETRLQEPGGALHSWFTKEGEYQKRFLREPKEEELAIVRPYCSGRSGGKGKLQWISRDFEDGRGYRTMIVEAPQGWKEIEVPSKDIVTFQEWAEQYYSRKVIRYDEVPDLSQLHKYGYIQLDKNGEVTKIIDRTNPNARWDWYEIGGRWNGFFKLKPEAYGSGIVGKPGLQKTDKDYKTPGADRADLCRKGMIDLPGMRYEAGVRAAEKYDKFLSLTVGCPPLIAFTDIQKQVETEMQERPELYLPTNLADDERDEPTKSSEIARQRYRNQPGILALQADEEARFWWNPQEFTVSRFEYIIAARNRAFTTFAVLKEGKWYEKGEMGWFGCVHEEKDQEAWDTEFNIMIDSLPDSTLLTIVDCHI